MVVAGTTSLGAQSEASSVQLEPASSGPRARPSGVVSADAAIARRKTDATWPTGVRDSVASGQSAGRVIFHDAAVGAGIGALAGAVYVLIGTQQPRVIDHSLDPLAYAVFTVGGAAAGLLVGAVVGGIRAR